MTVAPGIICVGGVFFFHFWLVSAIMLYNLALAASVSNALHPLIKHQRAKQRQLVAPSASGAPLICNG